MINLATQRKYHLVHDFYVLRVHLTVYNVIELQSIIMILVVMQKKNIIIYHDAIKVSLIVINRLPKLLMTHTKIVK